MPTAQPQPQPQPRTSKVCTPFSIHSQASFGELVFLPNLYHRGRRRYGWQQQTQPHKRRVQAVGHDGKDVFRWCRGECRRSSHRSLNKEENGVGGVGATTIRHASVSSSLSSAAGVRSLPTHALRLPTSQMHHRLCLPNLRESNGRCCGNNTNNQAHHPPRHPLPPASEAIAAAAAAVPAAVPIKQLVLDEEVLPTTRPRAELVISTSTSSHTRSAKATSTAGHTKAPRQAPVLGNANNRRNLRRHRRSRSRSSSSSNGGR